MFCYGDELDGKIVGYVDGMCVGEGVRSLEASVL